MVGTSVDRNPRTPQAGQGGNPWVKETVIGDKKVLVIINYYKNTNVVLGEQTSNINHVGDYYVCADKTEGDAGKCKIVNYNEWITTVKNCKKDPNSKTLVIIWLQTQHQVLVHFIWEHVGSKVYNPENNTGGADGCASADGTYDAHDLNTDYDTYILPLMEHDDKEYCGIGKVNGVRPAYPTAKGILAKVGNRAGSDGMNEPLDILVAINLLMEVGMIQAI